MRQAITRSSRRRVVASGSIVAAVLVGVIAASQVGAQGRHPVSGRRIAGVMGREGAAWLERPEREAEEAPSKAIAALMIPHGATVADIGAGSGYYSVRLAEAVGPGGRVYATDLQPQMLVLIKQKIDAASIRNIEMILGSETESRLPDGSVDLAIMVDVYHELAQPQALLASLKKSLRPNGRLVLIEFRKEDPRVPIREEHKMSIAEARNELEAEDFRFDRVIDVLPWQHILVFRLAPERLSASGFWLSD